jgi:serine protease
MTAAVALSGTMNLHASPRSDDTDVLGHRTAQSATIPVIHHHRHAADSSQADSSADNVTYGGGPVMHTSTTYAIFWLPKGYHFSSDDALYERLVMRYFGDIGGSSLYNTLTQYYDTTGYIQNDSTFGGAFLDQIPYPHRGTTSDPLTKGDIMNEVWRAILDKNLPTGPNVEFFVYTGWGIQSCDPESCTFGKNAYCAYHSSYTFKSRTVVFANMADPSVSDGCYAKENGEYLAPNGDATADSVISVTSHEHFEAVTDPMIGNDEIGWNDANGEIGDKCAWVFGQTDDSGANVYLNDDPYILQSEWSNYDGGCVLGD